MLFGDIFSSSKKFNRLLDSCKDWLDIKRNGVTLKQISSGEMKGWCRLVLPQYAIRKDEEIGCFIRKDFDSFIVRTDNILSKIEAPAENFPAASFRDTAKLVSDSLGIGCEADWDKKSLYLTLATSKEDFSSGFRRLLAAMNMLLLVQPKKL